MNEFIYVEFLFPQAFVNAGTSLLRELADDFQYQQTEVEWDIEGDFASTQGYMRVKGRINSETATALKLKDSPLAGYMRISYIPEELKNKYRT